MFQFHDSSRQRTSFSLTLEVNIKSISPPYWLIVTEKKEMKRVHKMGEKKALKNGYTYYFFGNQV
jgi:hypothetical protein